MGAEVVDQVLGGGGELDAVWLLFGTILVFFMQTGFAMLEAGLVSPKNVQNILLKNIMDASLGALCWFVLGFGIAQGAGDAPSFVGTSGYILNNEDFDDGTGYAYAGWLFQWAFAATTATIVSGAVAERCTFTAYCTYSVLLTSFIYPVVVHLGWNVSGWASAWREDTLLMGCGLTDFAGSGVVHMTGGTAAFWAVFFLGERRNKNPDLPGYAYVFQLLGTMILWVGWFGFNGVSTLYIVNYGQVAAKVMVCTVIAAASGAVMNLWGSACYDKYVTHVDDHITVRLGNATNGALAGLVGVTAGCSVVDPGGAVLIGFGAAWVYILTSRGLKKVPCFGADGRFGTGTIDDVIDAIPVHGFCGFFGVVCAGLLGTEENYGRSYYSARAEACKGLFYGGDGSALGANLTFCVVSFIWTSICSICVFGGLKTLKLLRVAEGVEDEGMDVSEHGATKPQKTTAPGGGAPSTATMDSSFNKVEKVSVKASTVAPDAAGTTIP